ncbi:hypothetical protein AXFE_12960 [Acidithrix ferrooxidans]|uniref:Uncharacterized protein n=1 Tax=Acidithrix ferrooxidans TaxID=1280514 RepID=A0A0D8HIV4_9ACTN|nr:hypothetical protein AXFE_12960 [Acidithrix ferrooxidans]
MIDHLTAGRFFRPLEVERYLPQRPLVVRVHN